MNESYIKNVIEASLLAAGRPLQLNELAELFDEASRPGVPAIREALTALEADYEGRGIELKETATGFRIQVRRDLANEVSRLWPERPPRYSRALLETLALIAYRQPITRAEIEAVRGVAVNPNIVKTLLERNWVRVVGNRDVPGRPELLGTTKDFLDYFGLRSLEELPPLADLKAMGDVNLQLDLSKDGTTAAAAGAAGAIGMDGSSGTDDGVTASGDTTLTAAVVDATLEAGTGAEAVTTAGHDTDDESAVAAVAKANPSAAQAGVDDADADDNGALDDDDSAEDDELSAAGPASRELVAAPANVDD